MNTKRVNGAAGVILAALTQNRTPAGIALALESAGLLMTPETAEDMASTATEAVRVAEESVTELRREHAENARLRERIAELEDEAATAGRAVVRAHRERDLMRERVSEPYGCAHCGEAQGSHGRQYIATVGMHSWERPSDDQVKSRMLARRAARLPMSATSELERGSALPWAHAMSDGDLHLFLDDLVGAAMNRWRTEPDGTSVPDRETLALVEEACARWRTPGEGNRLDGSGLDGIVRLIAPTQALQVPEPGACEKCTDGPADWCPGCSTCRCETHNPGCVQAGNPR
ncbi:hypothetical protein TR631_33605 [Streptomyces rochei]|uniref:hypothetical protein n=1 Tax=Streptomyces rochei TaxID=1928 RepID=UPI002ACD72E5|nr:hypothetical protein [Streptomyces rochei]WQC16499.1 hypothetical protein TR631_33605 [Streptomyces rochei]